MAGPRRARRAAAAFLPVYVRPWRRRRFARLSGWSLSTQARDVCEATSGTRRCRGQHARHRNAHFDPGFAARVVRDHIGSEVTHLVTTTLDSDDALARSFVAQAQTHARAVEYEIINFVESFRLIERTGALYCRLWTNPFITAVERRDEAKTIWGYPLPHATDLERVPEVRDVISSPLWLQVVHGGNVAATDAWGLCRAWPAELSRHLSLEPGIHLAERTRRQKLAENTRRRLERMVATAFIPRLVSD